MVQQAQGPPTMLRQFGLVLACLFAIFFGILIPWRFGQAWPWWPWLVSGTLLATAAAAPRLLRPVYWGWTRLGHGLGWLNVRLLLGTAFFVVFTPAALLMRLLGRDPLRLRRRHESTSHRQPSAAYQADEMRRPF